ncbi:MAG TPA: hypothetical protein GX396_05755 [Tissierellia bacterium]|nr:hypothetical protein [Tissierellia bacterium]
MKKIIKLLFIILFFIIGILYFKYGKELISLWEEKKEYKIKDMKVVEIDTLDEYEFFNKGIITYNSQKIIHRDYNNNIVWEKENKEFTNEVFTTDTYIYLETNNTITVLDKNNQQFIIDEINGNIVNVSRETDKTAFIVMGNGQTLYVMDDNNQVIVDGKEFKDSITGITFSDKSKAYVVMTLTFDRGNPVNTVYFNLMDNVEVWSTVIESEILIKAKIINNQVILIGTENIYFYNNNGKLMWKNSLYNKVLDYDFSKGKIHLLVKKDKDVEYISYNFEGKVMEIQAAPHNVSKLKIYEDKVFAYGNNSIYILHNNKSDKIFEDMENFKDFIFEGSTVYILFKDKLYKGQIKFI